MKSRVLLCVTVVISIINFVFFSLTTTSKASDNGMIGSINDPIITKSYLEQNIKTLVNEELKLLKGNGTGVSQESNSSSLTIIQLQPTQTLYGGSGTEIIVRTGKVTVTSTDDSGIADVTSGKDITAGQAVELNHLLIVPREGRGIKPDQKSKQDIFVMVRGSYSILNADGTKATQ